MNLRITLVLLGLVAVASAYQVQRDPCAWGPTYWCKSRTNAQQCRQVHYCRENFWKLSLKSSVLKSDTCGLCKLVVNFVDQYLKANNTEEEVKDELDKVCSDLGAFKAECNNFVNQYFDLIWQLLLNEVNADNVCGEILHLCNSTVAVGVAATHKSFPALSDKECGVCTRIVGDIGKVVNNSMTEEVAKEVAKTLCDSLGPAAPECKLIIDAFFDDIWKMLDKELTPQEICTQLKLCTKNVSKAFFSIKKPLFGVECSLCKSMVGEMVKKLFNTSTAQDKIKGIIKEVCDELPNDTDQNECRTFIDTLFPTLWNLLINDVMTPDNICNLVGMCGNTTLSKHRAPFLLTRIAVKERDYPYCDICKEVDEALKGFIDGANETEIKQELKTLCRYLPSDAATECTTAVDNYFDLVWTILEQYIDNPEQFCELLNLCNSTARADFTSKAASSGVECEICETVIKVADLFFTRNSTEDEVLSLLQKGCTFLPSEVGSKCTGFVEQYGRTIYTLLINEMDPDKICSLLGACTNSASNSGEVCDICEEALTAVKSLLPVSTDTVVAVLTKLCGVMPEALQGECQTFVKQYGPELVPLIAGLINPDEDCQTLGLCSKMGVFKMRRSL